MEQLGLIIFPPTVLTFKYHSIGVMVDEERTLSASVAHSAELQLSAEMIYRPGFYIRKVWNSVHFFASKMICPMCQVSLCFDLSAATETEAGSNCLPRRVAVLNTWQSSHTHTLTHLSKNVQQPVGHRNTGQDRTGRLYDNRNGALTSRAICRCTFASWK